MIYIFPIYQGLICGLGCDLSWRTFHMHLKKRWNPSFLSEMPCRYQLGLTSPMYQIKLVSLLIFFLDDLSVGVSRVLKSPTIIVLTSISPLIVVSMLLYIFKYFQFIENSSSVLNLIRINFYSSPWKIIFLMPLEFSLDLHVSFSVIPTGL